MDITHVIGSARSQAYMKCSTDLSYTLATVLHVCPIPGCRPPGPVLGAMQQGKAIELCASCLQGRDCLHPTSGSPR